MDPLSIICAAGTATQAVIWISTRLYTFVASSAAVERLLSDLLREIDGLTRVLRSIETSLKEPVARRKQPGEAGEDEIWASLDIAIKDTQYTVGALHGTVQALTTQKATSFFRRAVKQVKLNLDADEIREIKGRVHTHTNCLQLALQMATMLISSQSSNDIHEIYEIIQDLRSTHRSPYDRLPSSFKNPNIMSHTERLISSATTVIGQRSTVWGGSEAGLPQSSEAGGSLDKIKKSHIEDWIPQLTITEEEGSQTSEHKALTATTDTAVEESGFEVEEVEYSDSDGDDNYDFAQKCFERAKKSFSMDEHGTAVDFFRAGLKRANRLTFEKQCRLGYANIKRELALSLLYQGNLDESEELLLSLVRAEPGHKRDVELVLHASSGLAVIFLCRRSWTEAEDWCKKNRNGWRRSLKTQNPHYHIESLKMTAFLHELKGDSVDAQAWGELANEAHSKADKSIKTPDSLAFTFEQARDLIKNYHRNNPDLDSVHEPLMKSEADAKMKVCREIHIEKIPAPRRTNETRLLPYSPTGIPKPQSEVAVCDLGTSPQSDIGETLQEARPLSNRSSFLSETGTPSLPQASSRGWRFGSRTESVISKEALSLSSDSQHGENKSFTSKVRDSRLQSTLLSAARKGDVVSIEKSLVKGALVDSGNAKGETALCLAVIGGHPAAIETLIKHNAMIETKTKQGYTPLLCSKENVAQSRLDVMRRLLAAGADIQAKDNDGNSALFHAVAASRPDWTKVLLEYHPSLETRNNAGQTAILCALDFPVIAFTKPLLETVTLLLDAGADVKAKDIKGQTAILIFVKAIAARTTAYERYWPEYVRLVELLCVRGVDVVALSTKGASPMSLTGQIKDTPLRDGIIKTLRRYGAV